MRTITAALLLAAAPAAQFSKDAAVNLTVAGGPQEQVQAKNVPIPSGGSYVSWYDSDPDGSPAFGYDVRLQRLDAAGNALWGTGGVLIADRGFSSTQDYGLSIDAEEHALLAFRDDRFTGIQISAARISPSGTLVWGPGGIQLTNTSAFLASPRIAGTSDGDSVVAWSQDGSVVLQRLDDFGSGLWGSGLVVPPPVGGSLSLSALHASDAGSAIFSWVQQSGGFFTPRELWAMKLDDTGAPLWPLPGNPIFTSGSLQIGAFPDFTPDATGGAAFGWYGTSPLQCYAQHVAGDGTLDFGPNGSAASNDLGQVRANPHVTYDDSTAETYLFWDERNSTQSQSGFYGQKFNAAGASQWGATGLVIEPVQSGTIGQIAAVRSGASNAVVWEREPSFGMATISGVHLDSNGSATHTPATLFSLGASIDDFTLTRGTFGDAQLAWHDNRSGSNDVYAQNLTPGGALGPAHGVLQRSAPGNPDSYALTSAPLGATATATLDLTTTSHPFGVILGYLGALEVPLGGSVLLVNVASPFGELLGQPIGSFPTPTFNLPVPNNPAVCGLTVNTQGAHLDALGAFVLTNAQDWTLGL